MIWQIAILRRAGLTAKQALKLVMTDSGLLAYSQFPPGGDLIANNDDGLITREGDDLEWQKRG